MRGRQPARWRLILYALRCGDVKASKLVVPVPPFLQMLVLNDKDSATYRPTPYPSILQHGRAALHLLSRAIAPPGAPVAPGSPAISAAEGVPYCRRHGKGMSADCRPTREPAPLLPQPKCRSCRLQAVGVLRALHAISFLSSGRFSEPLDAVLRLATSPIPQTASKAPDGAKNIKYVEFPD